MFDFFFRSLYLCSFIAGVAVYRSKKHLSATDRILPAFLPTATLTIGAMVLQHLLITPFWDRNASRLVGAFALKWGLPLYPDLTAGPVQSMNYPPLAALVYWPATLMTSPTSAILAGASLNVFYFHFPILLILFAVVHRTGKSNLWLPLAYSAFFLSNALPPLAYAGYRLHCDAPALGLAALAIGFCTQSKLPRNRALWSSALCAIGALWTKQTLAPLLLGLLIEVAWVSGRRAAFHFALRLVLLAGVAAFLTILFVPYRSLLLNLFFITRKPWAGPVSDLLATQTAELLKWAMPFIAGSASLIALLKMDNETKDSVLSQSRAWLLISLLMIPVALLNRITLGGDVNAFALPLYFLIVGFLILLAQAVTHSSPGAIVTTGKAILTALVIGFTTIQMLPQFRLGLGWLIHAVPFNPQQQAFDYAKLNPGTTYFPWNPLSQLMAEHKLYHFEPAVTDWALAGHPLSDAHYRAEVPHEARQIAFHRRNEFSHDETLRRFKINAPPITIPELSGWWIYPVNNP